MKETKMLSYLQLATPLLMKSWFILAAMTKISWPWWCTNSRLPFLQFQGLGVKGQFLQMPTPSFTEPSLAGETLGFLL